MSLKSPHAKLNRESGGPKGSGVDSDPTPKKKAAPKAASKANAKDPSKKRGAPKIDPSTMLRCALAELLTAGPATKKFFGPEWKNTKRNWDSYIKGIEQMKKEEEDDDQLISFIFNDEKSLNEI